MTEAPSRLRKPYEVFADHDPPGIEIARAHNKSREILSKLWKIHLADYNQVKAEARAIYLAENRQKARQAF